jgi:hypothetical protein
MPLAIAASGRARSGVSKSLAAYAGRVAWPGKTTIAGPGSEAAPRSEGRRSRCPGSAVAGSRRRKRSSMETTTARMEPAPSTTMKTTTTAAVKTASATAMEAAASTHMATATAAVLCKHGQG